MADIRKHVIMPKVWARAGRVLDEVNVPG